MPIIRCTICIATFQTNAVTANIVRVVKRCFVLFGSFSPLDMSVRPMRKTRPYCGFTVGGGGISPATSAHAQHVYLSSQTDRRTDRYWSKKVLPLLNTEYKRTLRSHENRAVEAGTTGTRLLLHSRELRFRLDASSWIFFFFFSSLKTKKQKK